MIGCKILLDLADLNLYFDWSRRGLVPLSVKCFTNHTIVDGNSGMLFTQDTIAATRSMEKIQAVAEDL